MTVSKVMVVDDHPLFRRGILQLLEFEEQFVVVCEASNGADAIALANSNDLDLILLDLNMKGLSGLDTLVAMRKEGIDARVVILTVSDSVNDIDAMIEAGADGYLLKDTEPDELIALLLSSLKGDSVFSEQVKYHLENRHIRKEIFESLTDREYEILTKVAQGFRNKQVADQLFISESTVKVHMKSLLKKLQVTSRTAATVLFLENVG